MKHRLRESNIKAGQNGPPFLFSGNSLNETHFNEVKADAFSHLSHVV